MRRRKNISSSESDDANYQGQDSESDNSSFKEVSTLRMRFTPEEDQKLKELVKDQQNNRWEKIAQKMPGRTARQCRDRYNNYLFKEISYGPWTEEEDNTILRLFKEIGPKWTQIAQSLVGRSGNNVKNRWYKHLKKFGKYKENKRKDIETSSRLDLDKIWPSLHVEAAFAEVDSFLFE